MRQINHAILLLLMTLVGGCDTPGHIDYSGPISDWPHVGGNHGRQQYSPLDQITRDNVDGLRVAWVHHSGDYARAGDETGRVTAFEASPLVVNDTLYYCTPFNRVFALDPETGEERWVYDPEIDSSGIQSHICRGVTYWEDSAVGSDGVCHARISIATVDARLISLDADTGKPCIAAQPVPNMAPLGKLIPWGGMALGGNLQTAGGLVFIGATMDAYFRAFDVETGEELRRTELPYAAHAMPMTYRLEPDSRQFVVIAAGGKGLFESVGSKTGDALVAFSLQP